MTDYNKTKAEIYADEMKLDVASLKPVILDLLGNLESKMALDFGCGSGRFSKIMGERGAYVRALDTSEDQIALAEKINSNPRVQYFVGDEKTLEKKPNKIYDIVLMNMVLPSLDDKEKAEKLFSEISRVLENDGRLIVSTLHPLFLHPIQGVNDRATDFNFKKYFNEGHKYHAEAITTKGRTMHFRETHFSLEYISKLLENNNFRINKIREGRPAPELGCHVPIYLVMECGKHRNKSRIRRQR